MMPNLFFALWPDDATRAGLAELQTRVNGRRTRFQNLHLTLAFLGPQPDALMPLLRSILSHLDADAVAIDIDRLGHFKRNRIAWAGTHAAPDGLLALQRKLARELTRKGVPFDDARAFQPHITLARDADPPLDTPFASLHWHANHIVLARSPLPDEKPFYQVLASAHARERGQQALPIE